MASDSARPPVDPLSSQGILHRHQNRLLLLDRLNGVRQQIRDLEQEVADIEGTILGLPYAPPRALGERREHQGRRYSFVTNAIAGGIALPLAIGCMHPLDTVRTAMQAAIQSEQGFVKISQSLGLRGFARGLGTSILWASPQGAIRLGCYESCKGTLVENFDYKPLGIALSAILADLASSFVKVPRELITQRMQTGQYTSGFVAAQQILKEDGVLGLFRGYTSTCLRDAPFMVLLFFSYEQFKTWKIRLTFAHSGPAHVLSPWSDAETVLWGGISGALAGMLTTPFDVVKTQIMTSRSALTIGEVVRTLGPFGLFRGSVPRSAWWFCVCSIFFSTFERLRIPTQDWLDGTGPGAAGTREQQAPA